MICGSLILFPYLMSFHLAEKQIPWWKNYVTANISVAKIHEEFSEHALLRKHPAPPPSNYEILVKAAKSKVWFHSFRNIICIHVVM